MTAWPWTTYLIAKDVVDNVVLFGRLRGQDKGLHESSHGEALVGQLSADLDDDAGSEGSVGIHLLDLGVAVLKVELSNALMNLLLTVDRLRTGVTRASPTASATVVVQAPMDERGVV